MSEKTYQDAIDVLQRECDRIQAEMADFDVSAPYYLYESMEERAEELERCINLLYELNPHKKPKPMSALGDRVKIDTPID